MQTGMGLITVASNQPVLTCTYSGYQVLKNCKEACKCLRDISLQAWDVVPHKQVLLLFMISLLRNIRVVHMDQGIWYNVYPPTLVILNLSFNDWCGTSRLYCCRSLTYSINMFLTKSKCASLYCPNLQWASVYQEAYMTCMHSYDIWVKAGWVSHGLWIYRNNPKFWVLIHTLQEGTRWWSTTALPFLFHFQYKSLQKTYGILIHKI